MHRSPFTFALLLVTSAFVAGCPSEQKDPEPEEAAIDLTVPKSNDPLPEDKRTLPPADLEAAVDRGALRTPWAAAKVGDWATFDTPDGPLRIEVVAVAANTVTIARNGEESTHHLAELDRAFLMEADPDSKDPAYHDLSDDMFAVGDRELDCLVVTARAPSRDGYWFCPDLRVNQGVVLRVVEGVTVLKLTGFGPAE